VTRNPIAKWLDRLVQSWDASEQCIICHDAQNANSMTLDCGHVLHKQCLDKFLQGKELNDCPMCRDSGGRSQLVYAELNKTAAGNYAVNTPASKKLKAGKLFPIGVTDLTDMLRYNTLGLPQR